MNTLADERATALATKEESKLDFSDPTHRITVVEETALLRENFRKAFRIQHLEHLLNAKRLADSRRPGPTVDLEFDELQAALEVRNRELEEASKRLKDAAGLLKLYQQLYEAYEVQSAELSACRQKLEEQKSMLTNLEELEQRAIRREQEFSRRLKKLEHVLQGARLRDNVNQPSAVRQYRSSNGSVSMLNVHDITCISKMGSLRADRGITKPVGRNRDSCGHDRRVAFQASELEWSGVDENVEPLGNSKPDEVPRKRRNDCISVLVTEGSVDGHLSGFDGSGNLIGTILPEDLGGQPLPITDFDMDENGNLFVAADLDSTNRLSRWIPSPKSPHQLLFQHDNEFAQVLRSQNIPMSPQGVVCHKERLYVSSNVAGQPGVLEFDCSGNFLRKIVDGNGLTSPQRMRLSRHNGESILLVHDEPGGQLETTLRVFQLSTGTRIGDIRIAHRVGSFEFFGERNLFVTGCESEPSVSVYHIDRWPCVDPEREAKVQLVSRVRIADLKPMHDHEKGDGSGRWTPHGLCFGPDNSVYVGLQHNESTFGIVKLISTGQVNCFAKAEFLSSLKKPPILMLWLSWDGQSQDGWKVHRFKP
mmetsp:Transcript_744/g.1539  ORF Transcript_744/g.1539 Transcript_744/m.1539 type:complete len:591 (-) Transcript_744:1048-2820(-)